MNWTSVPSPSTGPVRRRSVLAAAVGALLPTSGCVTRGVETVVDDGRQVSLSLATVPTDDDRGAIRIARHLESNLEAVGVDVTLDVRPRAGFLEAVLLDRDVDLFVDRYPVDAAADPDFLYGALHSRFATQPGRQNPFEFTDETVDRLLEAQRLASEAERRGYVADLLDAIVAAKPFEPICRPTEHRLVRSDRFEVDDLDDAPVASRAGYLHLASVEDDDRLHALLTDTRPSRNCNPLSVTMRRRGTIVDLLYDSLGTYEDGTLRPWLADSWTWEQDGHSTTISLSLREGCRFHDGQPVTADDVAFTYRFLADTAPDSAFPSPAPRYSGRISAVDDLEVHDEYALTISLEAAEAVAGRALTVPILAEHVWQERLASERGHRSSPPQGHREPVTGDVDPVGSGVYRLANRSKRDSLTLERHEEHFAVRGGDGEESAAAATPPAVELHFEVDPNSASMVERIADGDADVTASPIQAYAVNRVPADDVVEHAAQPSRTFYYLGFNTRRTPCDEDGVELRRAITRLLDKSTLAENGFDGDAVPISTPVPDAWTPAALAWDGDDDFAGNDGDLDLETARSAFERAGLRSDEDGRLVWEY
ncbi:ABC transporter substrate-binding protein [Natronobacterium gregoryi]|uniref:ABC transporter substrate-binding protein n=2 Tax=Natronobacterium gregoryi TaxID=44930 RepID=L0AEL0_NATGS|nr:ABC transporter substrate-binding protein [Natronobacterium gregoryi]AFZ71869.1 extracellular solute-binding protein, family 5 [Natronobacterium gregoryi SP2]ELY73061.1 family 5 extracellular solute-binding protein [Natronobacterium gregoryi SP2]PLK19385.1 ABC transporter substrate-binding protein [Natronobacterium gregoryi SP2]SFJ50764.1 peptide/nickel transport system substrate-binding protein [Natronobacterium gregoryi]